MRLEASSQALFERGWLQFPAAPTTQAWAKAAHLQALKASADPACRKAWLRHGGTWFAGIDVLENDFSGSIGNIPLAGPAPDFIDAMGFSELPLHKAQLSITYPGYPTDDGTESQSAFAYRRKRFAAHIDGITRVGPNRRRFLTEPHAYILGLPLNESNDKAAPLIVWEGSPAIISAHLRGAFNTAAPKLWPEIDITEIYHAARRECFSHCAPVALHALPGAAYLIHRLALHGIGLWQEGALAPPEGRMIAYFRPLLKQIEQWLK